MKFVPALAVLVVLVPAIEARAFDKAMDYVCGKDVQIDESTPRAESKGVPFFFCSEEDKKTFHASPDDYFRKASEDYAGWAGRIYEHYFAIRSALANDTVEGVKENAKAIADWAGPAAKLSPSLDATTTKAYRGTLIGIEKAAKTFAAAGADIKKFREGFKALSNSLIQYTKGVELREKSPRTLFQFYCPMAKASWLQEADRIGNPYYGESMLTCGEKVDLSGTTTTRPKGEREGPGDGEQGGGGGG